MGSSYFILFAAAAAADDDDDHDHDHDMLVSLPLPPFAPPTPPPLDLGLAEVFEVAQLLLLRLALLVAVLLPRTSAHAASPHPQHPQQPCGGRVPAALHSYRGPARSTRHRVACHPYSARAHVHGRPCMAAARPKASISFQKLPEDYK